MKKFTKLLSLIVILISNVLFSQQTITAKIIEPFQKDALFREKVFIHLNKSIYFTNESIWFAGYVVDDENNTPSLVTSNLYVNLLNENRDVIEQKIVFIHDGIGTNEFFVGDKLNSGTYYVQGFTNYMKNFGEENVFLQKIEIINPASESIVQDNNNVNSASIPIVQESNNYINYDIQLFPESGYLLSNVTNSIGVKALVNGKGMPFEGKIVNSKDKTVATFNGNDFGMCKTSFSYAENETYTAEININNTIQSVLLPDVLETGIIFNLDSQTYKDLVKLTLITNKKSISQLSNINLAIVFYRNNHISEAVSLNLINGENTIQELFFEKSKMLNGVNIATLFKNNEPIAERKFFIEKQNEQTAILINELKTENDSITFKIETLNSKLEPISSQLSISVLPENSNNFYENQSIKSAFLLSPYVKGEIENPSYYFKNNNPKEKAYLDLLLLNQGWSTYSLEEKIKEINPTVLYKFESGFTLNGTIKRFPKEYNLGIISKKGGLVATSKIIENNKFSFENVFGYKNDSIKVALIKNKSPLVKPLKISFSADSITVNKFNSKPNTIKQDPIIKATTSVSNEESSVSNFNNYPNVEVLKQVVLKTVKSKRKRTFYDDEMDLASKHRVIAAGFYQSIKVTERIQDNFLNLLYYLRSLGMVKGNCPDCYLKVRSAIISFNPADQASQMKPVLYIDDVIMDEESQIEITESISMIDIDEILINRFGAGGGINAVGGILKIYRKKGNHKYFKYGKTLYNDLILLTGFDKSTDYYTPKYNIYTKDAYNWSEITWENKLQTNAKGETFIKVPTNKFSNKFRFIINGFSSDGLLFNTVHKQVQTVSNIKTGQLNIQ